MLPSKLPLSSLHLPVFPGRASCLLILLVALVDLVWLGVTDITLPAPQFLQIMATLAVEVMLMRVLQRRLAAGSVHGRLFGTLAFLLKAIIFLQLAWVLVRVFNHVSMASDFHYADRMLADWDKFFGFDWQAYFYFVQGHRLIHAILGLGYKSLSVCSVLAFCILVVRGEARRTRFFLEIFLFTAVLCAAIGMFFPAKGSIASFFGDAITWLNLGSLPGVYHLEHLYQLRSGLPFALDLYNLPGLVTFPSFHTAAAVVLAASFWRTRLFPLMAAYAVVVIASTPVLGGHYFVDILAGTALALLVSCAFGALPGYRGLFGVTAAQ